MAAAVLTVGAPVMGMADPISMVASAAETAMLTVTEADLLKLWDGADKNPGIEYLRDGWFILYGHKDAGGGMRVLRIDDDKWRGTGKVEYLELDKLWEGYAYDENGKAVLKSVDTKQWTFDSYSSSWDCFLATVSGEEYPRDFAITVKDGVPCFITDLAFGGYGEYHYERSDGYDIGSKDNFETGENKCYLVTPDGSTEIADHDYVRCLTGDIVAVWAEVKEGSTTVDVYGIKKDGSTQKIENVDIKVPENGYFYFDCYMAPIWWDGDVLKMIGGDRNVYTIDAKNLKSGRSLDAYSCGTNFILTDYDTYRLVDGSNGKVLSADYPRMWYSDSGAILVQNQDGSKLGYIDDSGKELGFFDAAIGFGEGSTFSAVVDGGKAWFIDTKMNALSNKIDVIKDEDGSYNSSVIMEDTDFFRFATKDGAVFAALNAGTGSSSSGSSDGKTAITDENTGISVNGVFPAGTKLNTTVKKNDDGYTWDITPVDASGNKVQPDGAAVVGVMLPEELKGKVIYVYRVEDGKRTKLNSWVDGDMLFFTTTHFSEFELSTVEKEEANPRTGAAAAGLAAVALAAMGAVIVSRKKH